MRNKHIGWMFLSVILLHIAGVVLLSFYSAEIVLSMPANFLLSEGILVVPALVFMFVTGRKDSRRFTERLGFRRFKWSSAAMVVLYALLLNPLATLVNAISMLFVENRIVEISGGLTELSFAMLFFFTAINAPFCEELVFRGIVYQSCRENSGARSAVLFSALLFALVHLNFNQAGYAFVLGIGLALAVEATGSLWSGMLIHFIFNGTSSLELFLVNRLLPGVYENAASTSITGLEMQIVIGVYLMIAVVTTALAGCVLAWIAKNEKREECVRQIFTIQKSGPKEKAPCPEEQRAHEKVLSVPVLLGMLIALGYMVFEVIWF